MSNDTTVIITAAGFGKRLGYNIPKSLVSINGKTIIERQLEILKNYKDIRIVVGFKANEVITHVKKIRKDILFVMNHNYGTTTPLNSLFLASRFTKKNILYIDGDLLISKNSIKNIVKTRSTTLGIIKTYSSEPVCTDIIKKKSKQYIIKFTRERREYEWSGLMYTKKENIKNLSTFVYQLFIKNLPLNAIIIDACEVDTKQDLEYAKTWIKKQ